MFFCTRKEQKSMNKNIQGHLFALTANILWGLMAPIGKSALVEFSALSVTTFRMVGAAACFWLLSLFCKREQVDHRDMLKIFFAALFALVFNQGVYIFGLSMTSPIDASIVTTTLPIVTMIVAAIYLKEPVTEQEVLGIFVGAMGAFILIMSSQTTGAGNGSLIGDLSLPARPNQLLHLSDRIQGVVAKILSHHPEQMDVCLCLHVLHPVSYHDVAAIQWSEISTAALLQAGYVVVGGSFLAYIFIMSAQRLLRPTVVSMYNYMQPIVASTVAIILGLGVFNLEKGIAIALVFLGVYIVTQSKSRKDFEKEGKAV